MIRQSMYYITVCEKKM